MWMGHVLSPPCVRTLMSVHEPCASSNEKIENIMIPWYSNLCIWFRKTTLGDAKHSFRNMESILSVLTTLPGCYFAFFLVHFFVNVGFLGLSSMWRIHNCGRHCPCGALLDYRSDSRDSTALKLVPAAISWFDAENQLKFSLIRGIEHWISQLKKKVSTISGRIVKCCCRGLVISDNFAFNHV